MLPDVPADRPPNQPPAAAIRRVTAI